MEEHCQYQTCKELSKICTIMNKLLGEIHNGYEMFTKKIPTNIKFQKQRKQAASLKEEI